MKCAQDATTTARVVRTVAELQMALADKARGQRIAQLRKRKHLTQQKLAERLDVGYRTVQTWEQGTMPEWPNLERLAADLGVQPEEIIGDDDVLEAMRAGPVSVQLDRIEAELRVVRLLLERLLGPETTGDVLADLERDPAHPAQQPGGGAATRRPAA